LLEALDFHKDLLNGRAGDCVEVEYRLHSWGEIFPPFVGDREHSIAARFILTEFPFKLFSSSTPYDDPLPQRLCLTFQAPHEERCHSDNFHLSGFFSHEIAKEFAAFLSLVTRRRIFVVRQMRYEGLPIEDETELYSRSSVQERQRLKEIHPQEIYRLLDNLRAMDRRIAKGFILSMRLYHSAIDMAYTEPEFAYLLLVISLEAIASVAYEEYRPDNIEAVLKSIFPGLGELSLTIEQRQQLEEVLIGSQKFTLGKLRKFVKENVPQRFWSENEDDAKPDRLIGVVGPGPDGLGRVEFSRSDIRIRQWERIKAEDLTGAIDQIYEARSRLIHEGIRLPSSIVIGHFPSIPVEALEETMRITAEKNETRKAQHIPPLLTFERLVSYSMVEFLSKWNFE